MADDDLSDVDRFMKQLRDEECEERELLAMNRLIKEMLRANVEQNRRIKAGTSEAYFEVQRLFKAMSENEKNNCRDTFRQHIRNIISDAEAIAGFVLGVDNGNKRIIEATIAVRDLDAYLAKQAEQQNIEGIKTGIEVYTVFCFSIVMSVT
ncbi:hypothetical protein TSUD_143340 [Trifolium subterraneum]|uniref:Uncharacterized protein n=1 Tax=Trifolium subterraneum TaxID=3900 RepID=A0A2Z6MQ69_TRISU|nr:hypothetical protein TSUD_143340 [Trifolium subterraneum]